MRGPRRGRGAMLAVRGHLRRRLASRRGFPSARPGAGALLSDVGRTAPLLPNLGLGGGVPFPSRGRVPGLLAVTLASKVSELPGWDLEHGTRPPPLLGPLARGSAFERPAILSSPLQYLSVSLSLSFCSVRRSVGRRENQAPNPLFGDCLLRVPGTLPPTFHRFWIPVLSPPVYGEWPSRAAEGMGCLSHSPWPGKEEGGGGWGRSIFPPPSKPLLVPASLHVPF